jgi:hypothetical protein
MDATKVLLVFIVLIALLVWTKNDGQPLFSNGHNVDSRVQAVGDDIKSLGRDTASSIRKAVQ